MSKEYTGELLATKIIGICMNHGFTVEEISRKIYKDGGHSKRAELGDICHYYLFQLFKDTITSLEEYLSNSSKDIKVKEK